MRGQDQQRFVGQRSLERLRRALETGRERSAACPISLAPASIAFTASPSDAPGARLNEIVTDRELALMVDRQRRRVAVRTVRERAPAAPARAVARAAT